MTPTRKNTRNPAPDKGLRRMTITISDLPPEALEALVRAKNRSALVREALDFYARARPVIEALGRLEGKIDVISARLAALEAGGGVPSTLQAPAQEPGDAARKAAAALAAWCGD